MQEYVKTHWSDNETPINSENLNNIENGIEAVTNAEIAVENELNAARGGQQNINGRFSNIENELNAARGGQQNLNGRFSNIENNLGAAESAIQQNAANISERMYVDLTTTDVPFSGNNPKIIYANATVDGEKGVVLTTADNSAQFFLGRNGNLKMRSQNGPNTYTSWVLLFEKSANKKNVINNSNSQSDTFFPTIKAVVDYITAALLAKADVNHTHSQYLTESAIAAMESITNKQTAMPSNPTDTQYLSALGIKNFVNNATENMMMFENITTVLSLSDLDDLVDEKKVYHFRCDDSSIDEEAKLIFVYGGETATSPSGDKVYPNSAQIMFTQSGRFLKRVADDDGVWGNVVNVVGS